MQALERLAQRGILERLDRRKLQQELDVHRLFLLTSYHARGAQQLPADSIHSLHWC